MIAVALVPRDKVREQLKDLGCEFVEAIDDRTDGYKTSWGFAFTVPAIGDDGMCPKSALYEVLASVERSRLK